eukprot:Gregarina_sp_Pseudo_9__168@NODE_110_length_4202_cov_130_651453_g102_i0_p1_GENE_NODE_110_length_4202_cov_130_651453_g102_i0NODE_110_length_4202_cov_130_651453_g102_i0_p1_ORF_typecomplete_len473_score5_21ADIP/PF11559_8/2_5e03ADIP/PF11559_8/0_023ADIP/PF11559_8/1_8e02SMC_N/PF02463_19/0_076AAA_13/PF13166_6/0_97Golgin_A5/PF09787_9/0_19Golgin_A5/PF09787_9/0_28Golgin_A5/PF09787_9/2_6e03UPF0242/PF06785_11/5_9UPF0242/PF06785_11/1_8DUF4407/PF14362_6/3_8DUF4407/PF14362_6/1_7DUF3829/PF12889_7/0_085DUF3829/PF
MGLEDQELFYSPEHRDRKDLHGYEIDDISEVVQLKAYLRRERQIAETRLKAIEQRDELIAALTSHRAQTDEGRLEQLELKLESEIQNRTDLTSQLQHYHAQIEEYRATLRRIVSKLEALIKRELWQLPEHMRHVPAIHTEDPSPVGYLNTAATLLERLNVIHSQVFEVKLAGIPKATPEADIENWRNIIREKDAELAKMQQTITALTATNKLYEDNIRVAEAQSRSLQQALDRAHVAADKDAETFQTLKTLLGVTQERNSELSATCDLLQKEVQELRSREQQEMELQRLRDLVVSQASQTNPIVITPSQDLSSSHPSNEDVEIHEITSTEEPQMSIAHPASSIITTEVQQRTSSETVTDLFYTGRNSREDSDLTKENCLAPNRGLRTTRRKKLQSPTEMVSAETMASEAKIEGSSSIGTSPDSVSNAVRTTKSKSKTQLHVYSSVTESQEIHVESTRTAGSPPRRRTRRAAI